MFLISTSTAARPDRQPSASSSVGTSVSPPSAVRMREALDLDRGAGRAPGRTRPWSARRRVVHDHRDVVGGHPHVELDHVGAGRDRRSNAGIVFSASWAESPRCATTSASALLTESSFRHYARPPFQSVTHSASHPATADRTDRCRMIERRFRHDPDQTTWIAGAACIGEDPELFFPMGSPGAGHGQTARAKASAWRARSATSASMVAGDRPGRGRVGRARRGGAPRTGGSSRRRRRRALTDALGRRRLASRRHTRLDGQRSFTGHSAHRGLRATQIARPWSMIT